MSDDVVIANARVWTGGAATEPAGAIRLRAGRVVAIEADAPPPGVAVLDAGGGTVIPAFVDAHLHLTQSAIAGTELDLTGVTSRAAFEAAIAARHAALAPGRWLVARGWSEERWGGAAPTRDWLRAAGGRPVVCRRVDMHAAVVNDAVLALGDFTRDPEGGRIARDGDGAPTGLLLEAAAWTLVEPLVPRPDGATLRAALLDAAAHLHRHGVTAVGSMEYRWMLDGPLVALRDRLDLRVRATLLDRGWPLPGALLEAFPGDDDLAIIGAKVFVDGTLGSRTAALLADYDDDPGNRGLFVEIAAEGRLADWARGVTERGLSPSLHAIGDAAVRAALDAIEGLPRDGAAGPRLEHAQQVDERDLPRFDGLWTSMQPAHRAGDGLIARRRLGAPRLAGFYPFRALAAHGARLAFGSDWPVVEPDPVAAIRAAVTGRLDDDTDLDTGETIEPAAALRAHTTDAARMLGLDDAGAIRRGARADLVVLDRDPLTADWRHAPPRVEATLRAGRVVWSRAADEVPA